MLIDRFGVLISKCIWGILTTASYINLTILVFTEHLIFDATFLAAD